MDLHAEFLVSGSAKAEDEYAGFRKQAFREVNASRFPAQALPLPLREQMTRYDDGPRVATPDNKSLPAGYTYFGQIIAHDLSSFLLLGDAVTPSLEMRSLYGAGPVLNSYLYWYYPDRDDYTYTGVKFRLEEYFDPKNRAVYDVPRMNFLGNNPTAPKRFYGKRHYPLMGDVRNDQNFILSQLHVAWMRFHNAMAEIVHAKRPALDRRGLFRETRRLIILHYQYLIVYDYLKKLVGEARFPLLKDMLTNLTEDRFVLFEATKMPRLMPEFTSAAFRIGHSQVRSKYMLQIGEPRVPLYVPGRQVPDLRGFTTRRFRRSLDWRLFFQYPGALEPQMSKALDLHVARELAALIFENPRDTILWIATTGAPSSRLLTDMPISKRQAPVRPVTSTTHCGIICCKKPI